MKTLTIAFQSKQTGFESSETESYTLRQKSKKEKRTGKTKEGLAEPLCDFISKETQKHAQSPVKLALCQS